MQHVTATSKTAAAPSRGRMAFGRWDAGITTTQRMVGSYGIRQLGRHAIKSGGVLFPTLDDRFISEYRVISEDKSKARIAAREDREMRQLEADIEAGLSWAQKQLAIEEKAKKAAARAADIYARLLASIDKPAKEKLYTKAEGKWWDRYEHREDRARALAEALPSDLVARYAQSSKDRLMGSGYRWLGGYVAGKYWQDPFVEKGLVSEEHWLLQRFIAATPKASSGEFKAGKSKDSCVAVYRKIIGYDDPYIFFGKRCKDMFRIDLDRWFADEAELNAWLDDLMERGILKFRPHVAAWIFDDRRGGIINPHLWFVLPEGSAVWPWTGAPEDEPAHVAQQHHMLNQVIASLTLALGGDPGGLSSPFHGKSPVSVHCRYAILNDEHLPTLSEYAKGMKLTHDAARMARQLMNARMADVGFDASQSNTWFDTVATAAREAAKQLYVSGFRIGDTAAFEEGVYNVTLEVMEAELPRVSGNKRETIEKLVEACSRWTVANFDPTKMDARTTARGAASHLITDDMTEKQKKGVGGGFASKATGERNRGEIAVAIRKALQAGGAEPTFRQIVEATGFSLNTVKKHWFPAYIQAAAALSFHSLVKGVNPTKPTYKPARPTLETLRTARCMEEIPVALRDPALEDHFRIKQLRANRSRRASGRPIHVRAMPGSNALSFLLAGGVTVYKRAAVDSQPVQS